MVEEDEEAPVDEPGPLLQGLQVAAEGALVDELLQPVEVLERGVPVLHQDLGGELAPHAVQIVLVRGLNKAWIIMELYFYQRNFGDPFWTGKLKMQDLRSDPTPQADLDEDAVEVEVLAGPAVVAALVLELGEVVAGVDHARLEVVTLHQEVQQLLAVPEQYKT